MAGDMHPPSLNLTTQYDTYWVGAYLTNPKEHGLREQIQLRGTAEGVQAISSSTGLRHIITICDASTTDTR